MQNYTSISLSKELLNIVDQKIKGKGYTSRAEFVRQAIRHEVSRLKQ